MRMLRKCVRCGHPFQEQGFGDVCPACILQDAADPADQMPDALAASEHGNQGHDPQPPDAIRRVIGDFELFSPIGEGGMGIVHKARQISLGRMVAVKVIKAGMDSKHVIARFEAERQMLARMDHPNIAKVHDAGCGDDGRLFFVMEFVPGPKITDYCDAHNLSIEERLALFIQVCSGVQHAHQKGIIHRDLKPSNILVTLQEGVPVPKIIDFGIAKATQESPTGDTLLTSVQQFLGTPAYMSPEQAGLELIDVDTRSDIYSLGVLLYELLTGHTPFEKKDLLQPGLEEMRRVIREKEPLKPSAKLTNLKAPELAEVARHQQVGPPELLHLVRGDLDLIVMKCLEKERGRRYETANGLAREVECYLNDDPVTAAPSSTLYRARKFVRRHRAGLATAAALLMLLVAGVVASTWQAVRAGRAEREQARLRQQAEAADRSSRAEAAKSREVARFLKDMLKGVDPSVAEGRDTTMLRVILDKTVDRVGKDLKDQPDVEAELLDTIGRVYWAIGDLVKAETVLRVSLAKVKGFAVAESPALATSLDNLAVILQTQGKFAEAEGMERQALAIRRKLLGNSDHHVAISLNNLAMVFQAEGKLAEAEAFHREGLALSRNLLGNDHPDIAESLNNLAIVLWNQGEFKDAEASYREALAILRKSPTEKQQDIAICLNNLASVLRDEGKPPEAEPLAREALTIERRLVGPEHRVVASFLDTLALLLRDQSQLTQAEATHRDALAMQRKVLGPGHPYVAASLNNLALVLRDQGKLAEAETTLRDALAMRKRILDAADPDVAVSLYDLAGLLRERGKIIEAEAAIRECLAFREKKLFDDWQTFDARSLLGAVLLDRKDFADAEPLLRSGYEGMKEREEKIPAPIKPRLRETLECLVKLHEAQGQPKEAAEWRKKLGDPE